MDSSNPSLFRVPEPAEVIQPVSVEQFKSIAQCRPAESMQLLKIGALGFDIRLARERSGGDASSLYASWIRSCALSQLLNDKRLETWAKLSDAGFIVHDAVIETAATFPLKGSSFEVDLFLKQVRSVAPDRPFT